MGEEENERLGWGKREKLGCTEESARYRTSAVGNLGILSLREIGERLRRTYSRIEIG